MICYITIYHVILYHCVSFRILPYLVNYLILILIFFFPSYDCGALTSCRFKILHSRFRAFHDTSWALRTSREGVRRRRVSSDHPWCLVTSTLKKGTFKYWKELDKYSIFPFSNLRKFCWNIQLILILSHLTSSHLISSYLISPHLISPHLISSYLTSSHLISSYLTSPHLILSNLTSSYLISPYLISSHLTSPHLISPHLTSSHTSPHLSNILSYLLFVISYHITSYQILSYNIMLYHIISCYIISYHIISNHLRSYLTVSYLILSYHFSSHLILCYIKLYYDILCEVFLPRNKFIQTFHMDS